MRPDFDEEIIQWVQRLLFLSLFLVLFFTMNLWNLPITFFYVGAITVLIVLGLYMIENNEVWDELNDRYLEEISVSAKDI